MVVLAPTDAAARYATGPRPVATLGFFDGVHRGHQAVLAACVGQARAAGGDAVVVTFGNHPREVLGGVAPPLLTPLRERLRLFGEAGATAALVLSFDAALAATPAEAFARDVFAGRLRARAVVVGARTRFGSGGRGTPDDLVVWGRRDGYDVEVVPPLAVGGEPVSSTRIRDRVLRGDLAGAAELLGRPPAIVGTVVRGDGRGRGLGFPTANLATPGAAPPPDGVHAGRPAVDGPPRLAVVTCAFAPPFGAPPARRVEVHVLDWSGDCYGRDLRVDLLVRLRDERKFPDVAALKTQIVADVAAARGALR